MSALELAAQASALQAAVHLTRLVADAGTDVAPVWTVDGAGAVIGTFTGAHGLVDLDRWRRTVGPHTVWSDRTREGLRWTIGVLVQDVMVRLVATAPARTAVPT
ncbi:hypothetical protein ACFVVU_23510 [Kitasatospora sp. NPDC057965]|uniref:hypothetical protein n=1 Tax=Kitasatospora sp. NPDC057965 TaxID=3346291 RepID=UPI0036DAAE5F